MIKRIILTLSLFLVINFSFAIQKIHVFHINGVNTTFTRAQINVNELEKLTQIETNMLSNRGHFDLLYNTNENKSRCELCSQLLEVLKQKKIEHQNLTIDDYVIAYMKAYNLHYERGSADYEILKLGIKDDYLKDPAFTGANLSDIYNQFNNKISQKERFKHLEVFLNNNTNNIDKYPYVLLLPHSQGNLYANELYDYLVKVDYFPSNHLAIFGIANPASKIKGIVEPAKSLIHPDPAALFHYVTANNDFVINSLTFFSGIKPVTDGPMPGNIHINNCNDFDICHSLIDAYLLDEKTKKRISKQINLFIISLKQNLIDAAINNKDSRFFYIFLPMQIDAGILLDINKQKICTNDICNKDLFKYLFLSESYTGYSIYDGKGYIADSQKIKAGEYWLASEIETQYSVGSMLVGNIQSAYTYNPMCFYDGKKEECDKHEFKIPLAIDDGRSFMSIGGHSPDKNYSAQFPELYYNNYYALSKFTVN